MITIDYDSITERALDVLADQADTAGIRPADARIPLGELVNRVADRSGANPEDVTEALYVADALGDLTITDDGLVGF
jgi:hypothetical protein